MPWRDISDIQQLGQPTAREMDLEGKIALGTRPAAQTRRKY